MSDTNDRGEQIVVRLTTEAKRALQEQAAKNDRTVSGEVRHIIRRALTGDQP